MANRGYDVVVDVDEEGDLGHTDLQEDNLNFHDSNFSDPATASTSARKPPPPSNGHARKASATIASKRYLWSVSFYAQFFDVDTNEVLRRCTAAVYPRTNFLDVLDGNPDLYGPFWIATTVVVILFLTGTISWDLRRQEKSHAGYDFKLLSGAAGLIYGYTGVIPLALWAALKWSGSEAANVLECWALYGYANVIWIPVSLISWSQLDVLNYVFVGIGFAVSAIFLTRNLYPVISTTPHQRAKILLILVVVLHAGLAIAIKFLFFAYHSPAAKGGKGSSPGSDGGKVDEGPETDTDGEGEAAMMRMLFRW